MGRVGDCSSSCAGDDDLTPMEREREVGLVLQELHVAGSALLSPEFCK